MENDKLIEAANYHYRNVTMKGKFHGDLDFKQTLELMQGYADKQNDKLLKEIEELKKANNGESN